MTDNKIVLYSYYRSSCSWRVRIALNYKGIPYTTEAVNLLKSEQKSEDYEKIHPGKTVPSLKIDGHVLNQSMAILEYLEETRPEKPLLPSDHYHRALVRAIVHQIASDIQPIQNLRVLVAVSDISANPDEKVQWARYWITEGFVSLEKLLQKTMSGPEGKYCVGDEFTMADVCLVPQVYNANRFNVNMSKFPNISRINAHLLGLKHVNDAMPENQPDFPCPQQ